MHIGIDVVTSLLPRSFQPVIEVLVRFLMIVINGYIFYLHCLCPSLGHKADTGS